jgi:hypothetical protein
VWSKSPELFEKDIINFYNKAVKPSVIGKATLSQVDMASARQLMAINLINQNIPKLKFNTDAGQVTGQAPSNINELSEALSQTKKDVFIKYDEMAKAAGDEGAKINLGLSKTLNAEGISTSIADELNTIINDPALSIVGKDAIAEFMEEGLHDWSIDSDGQAMVAEYAEEHDQPWEVAYEEMRQTGLLQQYGTPLYPVPGPDGMMLPKLQLDNNDKTGTLTLEKDDYEGEFDFIVDIEAMSIQSDQTDLNAKQMFIQALLQSEKQMNAQQGVMVKWKELNTALGDKAGVKDADQYFEKIPQPPVDPNQANTQMNGDIQNGGGLEGAVQGDGGASLPPQTSGIVSQGVPPVGVPQGVPVA